MTLIFLDGVMPKLDSDMVGLSSFVVEVDEDAWFEKLAVLFTSGGGDLTVKEDETDVTDDFFL
jgi:hypothetical protein